MSTNIHSTPPLSKEQLDLFLAANGLSVDPTSRKLLTPDGTMVGFVASVSEGFCLTLFEKAYTVDETEVTAWWPDFRVSWIVSDGTSATLGPTLWPDEVVCDRCNATIVPRPVPVVNTYALCPECFARTGLRFPGTVSPYTPAEAVLELPIEPDEVYAVLAA